MHRTDLTNEGAVTSAVLFFIASGDDTLLIWRYFLDAERYGGNERELPHSGGTSSETNFDNTAFIYISIRI